MKAKFNFITTMHVAFAAMSTVAAPSVSNVTMSQQKMSSNVTIMYDLSNESAIVTLDITTNGVSIGAANVTHAIGDVNRKVTPGNGKRLYGRHLSHGPITILPTILCRLW